MRRSSAYFSRRKHSNQIPQVPAENWVGFYSPVALIWGIVFLTVPFAYIYILLVLLREACMNFATLYAFIQHYVPPLGTLIAAMRQSSTIVELWCAIEAIFYVYQKLYIRYLQNKDPLEASLSAAPLMDADNRQRLWRNMMDSGDEPVAFVTGWFFDENIENISKYDLRDFICWSMFEARHQEHLTLNEVDQLESFCEELEYRISLHLYGFKEEDDDSDDLVCRSEDTIDLLRDSTPEWRKNLPKPKKRKSIRYIEPCPHRRGQQTKRTHTICLYVCAHTPSVPFPRRNTPRRIELLFQPLRELPSQLREYVKNNRNHGAKSRDTDQGPSQ